MSTSKDPEQIKEEVKAIKKAKSEVAQKLTSTDGLLSLVESFSSKLPWKQFKSIYSSSHNGGGQRSLRSELTEITRSLADHVRKILFEFENKAYSKSLAKEKSEQLRHRITEELKKGEETGTLTDETIKSILNESENVLKAHLDVATAEPTEENILSALKEIEIQQYFGAESECPNANESWNTLLKATKTLWEKANWQFRKTPTSPNFKKLLQALVINQQLGGNLNYCKPEGWQSVNQSYKVRDGDTLPGISNQFYKKQSYWDIIYIENHEVIGDDPDKLKVGAEITIP
jgi:nucleoid-associated protein YgaU